MSVKLYRFTKWSVKSKLPNIWLNSVNEFLTWCLLALNWWIDYQAIHSYPVTVFCFTHVYDHSFTVLHPQVTYLFVHCFSQCSGRGIFEIRKPIHFCWTQGTLKSLFQCLCWYYKSQSIWCCERKVLQIWGNLPYSACTNITYLAIELHIITSKPSITFLNKHY